MYHPSSDGSCGKTITLARDPVEFSGRGEEGEKRRRRKKGERKRRSRGGKFEREEGTEERRRKWGPRGPAGEPDGNKGGAQVATRYGSIFLTNRHRIKLSALSLLRVPSLVSRLA